MLPHALLAFIHIHVVIYFILWTSVAPLVSPNPPPANPTPWSHLHIHAAFLSVPLHLRLLCLLLLATRILALDLGYQISSADPWDEERKSAHCGRKEKVRSPIIHRTRALADKCLRSIHPSCIPHPPSIHPRLLPVVLPDRRQAMPLNHSPILPPGWMIIQKTFCSWRFFKI